MLTRRLCAHSYRKNTSPGTTLSSLKLQGRKRIQVWSLPSSNRVANSRVTITKRNKFHLKLEISTNGIPDTASKTNVRVIAHGRNLFPAESREIFDVNYEIGVCH